MKNKGFTIIELLIVIVIIGILVAITAVSYTGITNSANTAKAQSAARDVKQRVMACHAKNSTWPTAATALTCDAGGLGAPAGITVVAATTDATAGAAIGAGNQKTHVAYDAANGSVWYWDSAKNPAGAVKL